MVTSLPSLSTAEIAQRIDISAVRPGSSDEQVIQAVATARAYGCYLVTTLPSQTEFARRLLAGDPAPRLGGNAGFPSGGQTTRIKVSETQQLIELGVDEVDMVIDIAAHLSGRYADVYADIAAVVAAAQGRPVKVILECHYLTETQIRLGCDAAIKAGAAFVKTSTGWAPTCATPENVALIKAHVGDAIGIKAAGGIRSLETLLRLYSLGASRFGISYSSVPNLFGAARQADRPPAAS